MAALSGTSLLNVWFVWIATFRNRPVLDERSSVPRDESAVGELVTGPIRMTWSKPPSAWAALTNLSGFSGSYTACAPQPALQVQLSPPVGRRRTVLASVPRYPTAVFIYSRPRGAFRLA